MKSTLLTIALDATYSLGRNLSGVGIYSREISEGLARSHPEVRFLFCYRPHRLARSFDMSLPPNARRRLLWSGPPASADLFHALNQRLDARHRRAVSTFHDLFVLTAEYSTPEFRARFAEQARRAAERSDLIIAVSEYTARQLEQVLKVDRARIRVIPHGTRAPRPPVQIERQDLILFVGAIQKRKNVARLVQAFGAAPPGWKLVLAGASGFGSEEAFAAIESSPRRADIELAGYVTDAELERLYRRASFLAFPSLDEGFGIPVLEAMARGLPVLTSNCSAMAELGAGAALLVDPHDVDAIAAAIAELARNEPLRDELALKALERSAAFTWENAVQKTWAVYREVLPE